VLRGACCPAFWQKAFLAMQGISTISKGQAIFLLLVMVWDLFVVSYGFVHFQD